MISQEKFTLMNAFQAADNVLRQGVESISALINVPCLLYTSFLANGCALMGLLELAEEAGATVEGIGIAVEKEMCIRDRGWTQQMTSDYEFIWCYCPEMAERKYQENLRAKGDRKSVV